MNLIYTVTKMFNNVGELGGCVLYSSKRSLFLETALDKRELSRPGGGAIADRKLFTGEEEESAVNCRGKGENNEARFSFRVIKEPACV